MKNEGLEKRSICNVLMVLIEAPHSVRTYSHRILMLLDELVRCPKLSNVESGKR